MDSVKLCGCFHTTPEPGQELRCIVPYCSGPGPVPVSVLVILSVYTPLDGQPDIVCEEGLNSTN